MGLQQNLILYTQKYSMFCVDELWLSGTQLLEQTLVISCLDYSNVLLTGLPACAIKTSLKSNSYSAKKEKIHSTVHNWFKSLTFR